VRDLKKIVKAYEQRTKWIAGIATAILVAVLTAGIVHWFGWK
jgi:hypothetical protein